MVGQVYWTGHSIRSHNNVLYYGLNNNLNCQQFYLHTRTLCTLVREWVSVCVCKDGCNYVVTANCQIGWQGKLGGKWAAGRGDGCLKSTHTHTQAHVGWQTNSLLFVDLTCFLAKTLCVCLCVSCPLLYLYLCVCECACVFDCACDFWLGRLFARRSQRPTNVLRKYVFNPIRSQGFPFSQMLAFVRFEPLRFAAPGKIGKYIYSSLCLFKKYF